MIRLLGPNYNILVSHTYKTKNNKNVSSFLQYWPPKIFFSYFSSVMSTKIIRTVRKKIEIGFLVSLRKQGWPKRQQRSTSRSSLLYMPPSNIIEPFSINLSLQIIDFCHFLYSKYNTKVVNSSFLRKKNVAVRRNIFIKIFTFDVSIFD